MNFLAAFLLGLAGSVHCAVMCGPLLLAVNAGQRRNNFVYHAGRITVYGFLGAASGLIGAGIVLAGLGRWISIVAGVFILTALVASFRNGINGWFGRGIAVLKSKFGRLLRQQTLGATFLLGSLNGLLPCGMVYIACATAAAAGGVLSGVMTMVAFGLGTAPMLIGLGLTGRALGWMNPLRVKNIVMVCASVAGALLITRGILSFTPSGGVEPLCGLPR